jgi:hypothetical protein
MNYLAASYEVSTACNRLLLNVLIAHSLHNLRIYWRI